jgi:hypothetical protein
MRSIVVSVLVFLVIVGLDGCFTAPTYPTSPRIQLLEDQDNFYFSKGQAAGGLDELVVSLNFQDGDGDLGLATNETDPKYKDQYFFFISSSGQITSVENANQSNVNYKFKRQNPRYNLPAYSCDSWEIVELQNNSNVTFTDTIYTELNPNRFNILIDYYIKNSTNPSDTSYTKFDIFKRYQELSLGCPDGTLGGGRFPILASDPGKVAPLDGKLVYRIRSFGLDIIFNSNTTMKIRIRIQDRAFNLSNQVESRPFTLISIRR